MSKSQIRIEQAVGNPDRIVGTILRTLPEYFGFESAIVDYCENARDEKYTTFVALSENADAMGFAMMVLNSDTTAELWVMGVLPAFHSRGIGARLVEAVETEARKRACKYLLVKTIGPSQNDPNFLKTFKFYLKQGFELLMECDFLWAGSSCALLLKKL
ncbi:MAG: GNAT family N-acetyltransferase [Cyanobacteria bacterium SZAS LIN-2]|nr:GNAT family N-acetyltransferase [Cyanobacteria bacterium SZAS LIN-3]MBS1996484.1 GNAT family N-acetyltransferase [Cyanobacteria bacterium SZAS LIN-2]MBS2011075.1 GNAT family N-acetyltransferase [Cyanobacteria bacterium SZAS TMP-1]